MKPSETGRCLRVLSLGIHAASDIDVFIVTAYADATFGFALRRRRRHRA